MDDAAGLSLNMAWPALQNMYEEGVSHAKALRRSLVQQLRGNESFWRTLKLRDEVLAHIRWSSRILQVRMHVRQARHRPGIQHACQAAASCEPLPGAGAELRQVGLSQQQRQRRHQHRHQQNEHMQGAAAVLPHASSTKAWTLA
jgi:hypothetical protein